MNIRGGSTQGVSVAILAVLILGAFTYFGLRGANNAPPPPPPPMTGSENIPGNGNAMSPYAGLVLAGTEAALLDFVKSDYDKALTSDKLVVLYFYANWCPICRAEFPKMESAFNELATDKVIGFRVNYNDNATDDFEQALAGEFGVAYQHTKVFVKNGARVLYSPESWSKERYLTEINRLIAN